MKKILLLFAIALLPVFGQATEVKWNDPINKVTDLTSSDAYIPTISGPLCGTYYVGEAGDFTTLTQAVNYLNANGVSCAVTFILTNTLYENVAGNTNGENFPLTINNTINTTPTNTVTFKPAPNTDVTIKVNNIIVNNKLIHPLFLFKLNGANNVVFDGSNTGSSLNLINNDHIESNDRTVFWLTSSTNNTVIKNLKIAQGNYNGDWAFSAGVFQGSNNTVGSQGSTTSSKLVVSNNIFEGIKQGVYVHNPTSDITISNNEFASETTGKMHKCIYLKGVSKFTVSENKVKKVNTSFSSDHYLGIYIDGKQGTVNKNILYDIKRTNPSQSIAGIWLKSTATSINEAITVSNNFITNLQTGGGGSVSQGAYGIYIESGQWFKIYHNTINLKQDFQTTGISAALLIDKGTKLDVRNNIFNNNLTYNSAGRASVAIVNYSANDTFTHLDYNNYYSNGVIGIKAGTVTWIDYGNPSYIQTLSAWKTSLGKDTQSTNVQPAFVDEDNDLHLVPDNIINVQSLGGVSGLGITEDIDGDERYATRPTMGADEISETRCTEVVTWDGESWSNGQPANWSGNENVKIVISGPYTMGDVNVLNSCQLEIAPNVELKIGDGFVYIVEDKIINNGSILVENNGSLVQINNDAGYEGTGDSFKMYRKTQEVFRYDFTYWSSPVKDFILKNVSPLTLFDKFYSWNATANPQAWKSHPSNGPAKIMDPGVGYIVRAPQSFAIQGSAGAQPGIHTAVFEGIPNNGIVEVPVVTSTAGFESWNLIGNPYPSAIDLDLFIGANEDAVEGSVYLWAQNKAPSTTDGVVYTYGSDFAIYNKTGGSLLRKSNPGNEDDVIEITKTLAAGQSFFMKGKLNGTEDKVVFNNSMRITSPGENAQFFRAPNPTEPVENWDTTGKHRIWLNIENSNHTAFSQALVGYIENATNDVDWAYDAQVNSTNSLILYSLINNKDYTVQGKALPFSNQDIVPLGYKSTTAGNFEISLDRFDGLFSNQNIYLEDKLLNVVHDLKLSSYTFTTVPGTFNERFVLRYTPQETLGVDTPVIDPNSIIVFKNGNRIEIKSTDLNLQEVTVYDLLGRTIYSNNKINTTQFSTSPLNVQNQVIIVKVKTENNAQLSRKIIMN